jgi:hypothetical protein
VIVINGANHDQFMIGSNTLTAKNTFTQVSNDEWICLLQTGIMGHGIKVYLADSQLSSNLPQLASISLAAYDTGLRMIGHHQADNVCPVGFYCGRICLDAHIRSDRRDT